MGWSCGWGAGKTMEAWTRACVSNSGQQNVWTEGERTYMWETSRREYADGAVTGSVIELGPERIGAEGYKVRSGRKAGTIRIEGDGTVTRAPKWLKKASPAPQTTQEETI